MLQRLRWVARWDASGGCGSMGDGMEKEEESWTRKEDVRRGFGLV